MDILRGRQRGPRGARRPESGAGNAAGGAKPINRRK